MTAAMGTLPSGMLEKLEAQRKAVEDPFAELQRTLAAALDASGNYTGTFRLPPAFEVERLANEISPVNAFVARSLEAHAAPAMLTAMQAMRSPWLDVERELLSTRALGDLLAIGWGVSDFAPFEEGWTGNIRSLLGDWRDPIKSTPELSERPVRLSLYREQGLDPALTHFPSEAFNEVVRLAGLRESAADASQVDGEGDAIARSVRAFRRLHELERALRRFIADAMEAEFGPDWMRRQLPNGMLEDWRAKQAKAVEAGQPECEIIEYADFTDYRMIFERKDNWKLVFRRVFHRPEDVRESFQRIFPLRIATMHARPIEQDDELLLLVESRRLLKAIRH